MRQKIDLKMDINLQTKIGELLDTYPHLEDELIRLSSAFTKLKSPILRRTVAKVTTVQHAAKIAGISSAEMVIALRKAAGLDVSSVGDFSETDGVDQMPEWFDASKIKMKFNANSIIEAGGSPMADIIRQADELSVGEILEVAVSFRPEPIMDTLRKKAIKSWYDGQSAYFRK